MFIEACEGTEENVPDLPSQYCLCNLAAEYITHHNMYTQDLTLAFAATGTVNSTDGSMHKGVNLDCQYEQEGTPPSPTYSRTHFEQPPFYLGLKVVT